MIPVLWHGGGGNWDTAFPRYILDSAESCEHLESTDVSIPQSSAVICIPGRHSTQAYETINTAAAKFEQITFVVYGDEESSFDASRLEHPNMKRWYFMPPFNPKQEVERVAINGWPTHCREMISEQRAFVNGLRDYDWCFLGQVTHERREQCIAAAKELNCGHIMATQGFTQGVTRMEYYRYLCRSKIVLCPSGPRTPDSFRIAEALEANCIPIADDLTPDPTYPTGYFKYAFGVDRLPFPVISDWSDLPMVVESVLQNYPHYFFRCAQFWAEYKMRLIAQMREDLRR